MCGRDLAARIEALQASCPGSKQPMDAVRKGVEIPAPALSYKIKFIVRQHIFLFWPELKTVAEIGQNVPAWIAKKDFFLNQMSSESRRLMTFYRQTLPRSFICRPVDPRRA